MNGALSTEEIVRLARAAEREGIAAWHDAQAEIIEAALATIAAEGGTVEIPRRSLAELHRDFARAIRSGAGTR